MAQHDGSCEEGGQHSDLRDTWEVESTGFTDGLDAGVGMIPGPGTEQWLGRGAAYQGGEPRTQEGRS